VALHLSVRTVFRVCLFLFMVPRPPSPTLFPYTTLFRSLGRPHSWHSVPVMASPGLIAVRYDDHAPVRGVREDSVCAARAARFPPRAALLMPRRAATAWRRG